MKTFSEVLSYYDNKETKRFSRSEVHAAIKELPMAFYLSSNHYNKTQ